MQEFILQVPLEDVSNKQHSISKIEGALDGNKFPIWTEVQVVTKNNLYYSAIKHSILQLMHTVNEDGMPILLQAVY